jgi:hypothetical protein
MVEQRNDAIDAWMKAEDVAYTYELQVAALSAQNVRERAETVRQAHHLDLALAENRRLRAAIATMNPGAMLSACKRPEGSRLANDKLWREAHGEVVA